VSLSCDRSGDLKDISATLMSSRGHSLPTFSLSNDPIMPRRPSGPLALRGNAALYVGVLLVASYASTPAAQQAAIPPPAGCRITGKVMDGMRPLPGAAVVVHVGPTLKAATRLIT
jgi:hypothetical protein